MKHLPLAVLICGFGCGPQDDPHDQSEWEPDYLVDKEPDIVVEPVLLDFGLVTLLEGVAVEREVKVFNDGEADLHIINIELGVGVDELFVAHIGSVLIPVAGSSSFTVRFEPSDEGTFHDEVLIESDDPDTPVTAVEVLAEAQQA